MSDTTHRPTHAAVHGLRRAMVIAVVVSLSGTALIGIVALLGGGFAETARDILYTTLVVALFGTTALCHLAVVTRAVRAVGVAGMVAGTVAAVCAAVLIWTDEATVGSAEGWLKTFAVSAVVAVSLAHANLLLLLAHRGERVLRVGLVATLVAIAVVAVMIIVSVFTESWFGDLYVRVLGVVAILDALGTVALPVLARVLHRDVPTTVALTLELPADLVARLDAHDGSREDAAVAALARGLDTVA